MSKVTSLSSHRAKLDQRATDRHTRWLQDGIDHIRGIEGEARAIRIEMEEALAAWLEGATT